METTGDEQEFIPQVMPIASDFVFNFTPHFHLYNDMFDEHTLGGFVFISLLLNIG